MVSPQPDDSFKNYIYVLLPIDLPRYKEEGSYAMMTKQMVNNIN